MSQILPFPLEAVELVSKHLCVWPKFIGWKSFCNNTLIIMDFTPVLHGCLMKLLSKAMTSNFLGFFWFLCKSLFVSF